MADNEQIVGDLEVVDYSSKSIAVFGDTKPWAGNLKNMGGRYNGFLKRNIEGEDVKSPGWIFKADKTEEVMKFVNEANNGLVDKIASIPYKKPEKKETPVQSKGVVVLKYMVPKPKTVSIVLFENGTKEEYDTEIVRNDKVFLVKADNTRLVMAVVSGEWKVLAYWNKPHDVIFK